MTVLITGGTGFVGLALAEALTAKGTACVLFGQVPVPERFAGADWLAKTTTIIGDISDPDDVALALASSALSGIVHLAAVTPDVHMERSDPARVAAVNICGTAELLRQAAGRRKPRIVVASSVAVYGNVPAELGPISESRPPAPATLYGITKLAAEQTALRLADLYGLDLRVVRLGPVYGPWEWATGVRPLLSPQAQILDLVRHDHPVRLSRPMAGDWIYSRSAGAGIAALLSAPALQHKVYNLGGANVTTVDDWCAALYQVGAAVDWNIAESPAAANVHLSLPRDRAALSTARLTRDTGFDPRRGLADCAMDHAAWLASLGEPVPMRGDRHNVG